MEAQSVVIIQDASRKVCSSAIRWALRGCSLKSGDMLTLLGVLRHRNTPVGYKSRVNFISMFGANHRIVERAAARKKEEFDNNEELILISKLVENRKVGFKIEVTTGPSSAVALKVAEDLKATWVILDRWMKRDRKYFLAKLSCGISRIKRQNRIEQLRGPKPKTNILPKKESCNSQVTYDKMVPQSPVDEDLFIIEHSYAGQTKADLMSQIQELALNSSTKKLWEDWQAEELFQNSTCTICRNRRPEIGWKRDFTYAELEAATQGFSPRNSIYEGGTLSAFRGQLKTNMKIVVKQHKSASAQGERVFNSEVELLKKARHKNVVMLLGSCTEGSLRLLVYEYACNGSVSQHISKHCPLPLTWTARMKVALGAARGLNYLHENNIIHRNLRTSSIVLTHDFEPLLGDFGVSGVQLDHSSEHKVFETWGYLAPEYQENRKLSARTDVYAFGIVLLELLTGQAAEKITGGKSLADWAIPLLNERRHLEILDARIAASHDAEQLYWMGRVTRKCLSKNPKKRLTMDKVVSALECITDRQSCQVIEDISAVRSYIAHHMSNSNAFQSYEKTFEGESFSREIDVESRFSTSLSLTS